MHLCTLTSTGIPTFANLPNGSGLDLTGGSGDLMVRTPNVKYRYELDGTTQRVWIAPFESNHPYYDYHPHCYAGGGTLNSYFYGGAYEASLGVDASGNKILKSRTGVQPLTGGEIRSLAFTSGGIAAFTPGERLTGAVSGATGYVVAFYVSSGTWASGDASGTVYLNLPNITSSSATVFQAESLNGSISGADCATASGAAAIVTFSMTNALTYAASKGVGWAITDIYERSLLQMLYYIQTGTFDSQTVNGKGIVSLASGTGFAGKPTGSDSIDTNVDLFGTGKGTGVDGQVAISWNNYRNLWGNCAEYICGINLQANGSVYITKQNGTGTIAEELPTGSYETLPGLVPLSTGSISKIQSDKLGAITFIPSEDLGIATTYFCDLFGHPTYNPSVAISGGCWYDGLDCGIGALKTSHMSTPFKSYGCRLKYIPQ